MVEKVLPAKAQLLIDRLALKKTYEGVYLKRVYESEEKIGERPQITAAYGICTYSASSRFHKLDCDEFWHFYAGSPLFIYLFQNKQFRMHKLGSDFAAGEEPFLVIPKGTIFGALVQEVSDWCFFGCTCLPGFSPAGCEFTEKSFLPAKLPPELERNIQRLTF